MDYVCFKCGKTVDMDISARVRCPFCGGKIIYKKKPEIITTVKIE